VGDSGSGNNISDDVETQLVAFMVDFHSWGLSSVAEVLEFLGISI